MAVWSEVDIISALKANRLDADYYKPADLEARAIMAKGEVANMRDICSILNGRTPEKYEDTGSTCVVRSGDLVAPLIYPSCKQGLLRTVPQNDHVHLEKGDVLISSIGMGSIGKISLVIDARQLITVSEVTVLRKSAVAPEYIWAYLSSGIGRGQIEREVTGATGQQHLLKSKVGCILVPKPSDGLERRLVVLVQKAYAKEVAGATLYSEAQCALMSELGLGELDLSPTLFYERRYSEARESGRFDAEYWMPIKWRLLDRLGRLHSRPISELFKAVRSLLSPEKQAASTAFRNYDLTDALNSFLDDSVAPMEARDIGSTKKRLRPGDVVISQLRSYLGEVALVCSAPGPEQVGSSEFIVLRRMNKDVLPESLLVYLQCPWIQSILKWCQDGSNHPRFNVREVLSLPFPDVIVDCQKRIAEMVRESHAARDESRRLLEEAKRMVEEAVLKGVG